MRLIDNKTKTEERNMKYIVIDLEMNTIWKKPERLICGTEIIEIGAVMLDENLQEVSSFRTYVKPEYNKKITNRITKLTGITDEMVSQAPHFEEAFKMFLNWCLGPKDEVAIYAWSNADYQQVTNELLLKGITLDAEEQMLVNEEWNDFQNEFDVKMGFERQLSLSTALELAGIDFSGRAHDALDDARNTAELLQVYKDESRYKLVLEKIAEVMKPSKMENTLGSMFDFASLELA